MVVRLGVFLGEIFGEDVVAGGGESIAPHTAVVLVLVGGLTEAGETDDDVARVDVGVVDDVGALHAAGDGADHEWQADLRIVLEQLLVPAFPVPLVGLMLSEAVEGFVVGRAEAQPADVEICNESLAGSDFTSSLIDSAFSVPERAGDGLTIRLSLSCHFLSGVAVTWMTLSLMAVRRNICGPPASGSARRISTLLPLSVYGSC